LRCIPTGEVVTDENPVPAERAHPSHPGIADDRTAGCHMGVEGKERLVAPPPGQGAGRIAETRRREGRLEQYTVGKLLVHVVALHRSAPRPEGFVEPGSRPGPGVDDQVASELARGACQVLACEEDRGEDRACGEHRGAGIHMQRAPSAARLVEHVCYNTGSTPGFEADLAHSGPREHPRARSSRTRQVAQMHGLLGVDRATERAHAVAMTSPDVPADRAT